METKGYLSKVLGLHSAHLLPGQSDPKNANYGLSWVFGLSTETVPTRPADDIRPMVHINDRVGNMKAIMLVVLIAERTCLSLWLVNTFCCIKSFLFNWTEANSLYIYYNFYIHLSNVGSITHSRREISIITSVNTFYILFVFNRSKIVIETNALL